MGSGETMVGGQECRVVVWNINGVKNREKIEILRKHVRSVNPLFILLQETKITEEDGFEELKMKFRKYEWIKDDHLGSSRGVVIGVRICDRRGEVIPFVDPTLEGSVIGVSTSLHGVKYQALNVYRSNSTSLCDIAKLAKRFFQKDSFHILAGDFNHTHSDKEMNSFEDEMAPLLVRAQWDLPTHFKGRCIDHLFLPSRSPFKNRFVTAIPNSFRDHAVLIGGTSVKKWFTSSHPKSIPEVFINDPRFGKAILERVGDYKNNPLDHLKKIKTAAWEVANEGKKGVAPESMLGSLWRFQTLRRHYQMIKAFRKSTPQRPYSPLEEELLMEATWTGTISKKRAWRVGILPRVIRAVEKRIATLECTLGIHHEPSSFSTKSKTKKAVAGLLVEGEVVRDSKKINQALSDYWGNLFGSTRDFDRETLDLWIKEHPNSFPQMEHHEGGENQPFGFPGRKEGTNWRMTQEEGWN